MIVNVAGYTGCMVSAWLTEFVLVISFLSAIRAVQVADSSLHLNGAFQEKPK